ncbi:thiamine pyrophosphate-binding protein [Aequorivita todarodis]|uniref:thiamine pyrophosphate-dependent enzyme n=1 Tax=Aequorivita todarodis TaxID=2036821 RepID=UPI002350D2E3|nr:thiamine pyrophosphate-dependent enzyme [Aequorivita todarodis]MDC7999968.1 thiamine pyrophosphate-binding protein [Aequorivita todarodis]
MNVSEQIIQILKSVGVTQIWGVTGDALNTFTDALRDDEDIKWIAVRHEENGAFAAGAEAQMTDNLAVCAGTVGPGTLHLINGLYNAKKERVPVLAISGQVARVNMGTNYFQEVGLTKIFDDVCAYQAVIRSAEEAPRVVLRAIQIALEQRAVVRVEVPVDIAVEEAEGTHYAHPVFRGNAVLVPSDEDINKIANAINEAKKITILAGAGCRNSREKVLALSEKIKAPIAHTFRSSDIIHNDDKNVVGLTGLIGNPSAYHAVMKPDLLLMLGTDFPYSNFLPDDVKIIQVDTRAENIGNRVKVDIGVQGDILATLQKMDAKILPKNDTEFLDTLVENFKKWKKHKEEASSLKNDEEPLHPQLFMNVLNKKASDDACFTVDVGESAIWVAHHLTLHGERRLLGSFNHGSMAVGFPAAMGIQSVNPGRQVWAIVGDGAFGMCMNDFITAVRYNWPAKILVYNNSQLGFVKIEMEEAGYAMADEALGLQNPNFAEYAKLCGGDGVRVEHAADIEKAIEMAIASPKPFIIDAITNPGELSLPPNITLEEAWGFGKSKVKEILLSVEGDKNQKNNLMDEIKAFFHNSK